MDRTFSAVKTNSKKSNVGSPNASGILVESSVAFILLQYFSDVIDDYLIEAFSRIKGLRSTSKAIPLLSTGEFRAGFSSEHPNSPILQRINPDRRIHALVGVGGLRRIDSRRVPG
jgi:hypothetical protein